MLSNTTALIKKRLKSTWNIRRWHTEKKKKNSSALRSGVLGKFVLLHGYWEKCLVGHPKDQERLNKTRE